MLRLLPSTLIIALAATACQSAPKGVRIAHLDTGEGFDEVQFAFEANNPDYDLDYHRRLEELEPSERPRVVFVQAGPGIAEVRRPRTGLESSRVDVGDIVLVRPGDQLTFPLPLTAVVFGVPKRLPKNLPTFIRPDWDPLITDVPGGCATETGAYRRILMTWKPENGPYVYRGLNAHRVRITDSFTHYHPKEGGFDELYLVQMVQPRAHLITSRAVEIIEAEDATQADLPELFDVHPLSVGDLVYLPRGTIHAGRDGVLAQVIAVPGFRPGAEIGVDDHIQAIAAKTGPNAP